MPCIILESQKRGLLTLLLPIRTLFQIQTFIMEKKEKKIEVQWKKTFKITQKKVQRTLQSLQLVLLKMTRNEKTHVPDQLFILTSSAFKNSPRDIRKRSLQKVSRSSPSAALSVSQKKISLTQLYIHVSYKQSFPSDILCEHQ